MLNRTVTAVRQRPIIISLYLPWFLIAIGVGMMQPIMPLYATEFGASYSLVGLVLAAEGLGQLIGDVPAGVLLRKYGGKNVMLIGAAGIAISLLPLIWATSVLVVIAMQLIGGFSRSLFMVAQHTYLAQNVTVTRRGRAISVYGGVMRIGNLIGPALGGYLGAQFGLRAAFPIYALIGVLVFLVVLFFVEHHDVNDMDEHGQSQHVSGSPLWTTLRDSWRILTVAGMASLLAQMIRQSRKVLLPLIGRDLLGLNVDDIGLVLSVASALDVLLFFPAGIIMDRFGRKWAIIPCFGIQAVAMLLLPLVTSFAGLMLVAALLGFGNGLGSGTMMTLGSDLAPPATRSEFLGIWRLIGDGGFTGAPIIVGGVADALTLNAAALAMAASGLGAVLIFGLFVPETLDKSQKRKRKTQNAAGA
ncbi:MFS transporter [Phototrophicus methaneseepsis]|uniref:MFS transporter n=1 Tax=Phototrophicus methaneseepsis TaxID=2710758 RepID=A0A7S8IF52_9CHLR|nr:MFS transporter [Phototrophicus methaneseepsis]QPC83232.1 MFS transporter [Phototrophicus methaneseepsis]